MRFLVQITTSDGSWYVVVSADTRVEATKKVLEFYKTDVQVRKYGRLSILGSFLADSELEEV